MYVQKSVPVHQALATNSRRVRGARTSGTPRMAGTVNDSTLADGSSEYEVIGEHLTDPLRLLTIDGEGRLFELNLETCSASPTELTEDWVVDVVDTSQYRRHLDVNAPLPALVIG